MIARLVGSGPPPSFSRTAEVAAWSAPASVAAVTALSASPTWSTVSRPSRSAAAMRNSSRRRTARAAVTASSGVDARPTADRTSASSTGRARGTMFAGFPSIATASGARSSRSAA